MKRIFSLLLSLILLTSCLSLSAFAVTDAEKLDFKLTVDGNNVVSVQPGEEIEVSFFMNNVAAEAFNVTNHQTQIKVDETFFEYANTPSSYELVKANSCTYGSMSLGTKVIELLGMHISNGQPARFEESQLVAKIKLKVKEGLSVGDSRELSFFYFGAANALAEPVTVYKITGHNLTVFIGEPPAEMHTIVYKDGDATISTGSYAQGSVITINHGPSGGTDKKFVGWEDESGNIWNAGESYSVTGDMTFTAKWANKYTLHFETNGGTAVADKVEWEDNDIVIAEYTTTKSGSVFDGWYEDAQFTTPITANFKLTSDKTIYAKWTEAAPQTYTLTFETNGGSSIASVTQNKDSVISLDGYTPTRTGYTFVGWYTDEAFTNEVTSVTLDSNKIVYAKWSKNSPGGGGGGSGGGGGGGEADTKYTITFKNTDGTDIKSVKYEAGTTVDLEKHKPEKHGYNFEGWYTDKELTDKVSSIKLTKDIVLYAKWSKKEEVSPSKPNYHPDILTTEHYAYIIGREGNKIEPLANITRAEVATIFFRLLTEEVRNENIVQTNSFADVNEDDWFNTAVSTLAKLEIVKGRGADMFDPNANISRAEFTTIAARFSDVVYNGEDLFSDIDGHWAKDYINAAASIGWVVGDNGKFRPDDNITRAEVMTLVNRMLNRIPENKADLLDEMTCWDDNANTEDWYYIAVQEATNSHNYELKTDGVHEKWTSLSENFDWIEVER